MSIELKCEGCGKTLRAPREAAGKRKKCPSCGYEIYVPTPEDEIEELPLAPEDTEERRREEALLEERRRVDRELAKDQAASTEGDRRPSGQGSGASGSGGADVEGLVLTFLRAMRDADLDRAEQALTALKPHRSAARALVDQLAADQIPPGDMANVPAAVYQGFLKNLRSQL